AYRGQSGAGLALVERLLALPASEPPGIGRFLGLQSLSVLAQDRGDFARAEWALHELEASLEHGDWEVRLRALTQMGNFLNRLGRFEEGQTPHRKALELAEQSGASRMLAVAHCNLGESLFGMDRINEAMEHWRISAALDEKNGNIAGDSMLF